LTLVGRYAPLRTGDPSAELAVNIGPNWNTRDIAFLSNPGPGIQFYTSILAGAIRHDRTWPEVVLQHRGKADFDGDGEEDLLVTAFGAQNACLGFRAVTGEQQVGDWRWRFSDSTLPGYLNYCQAWDFNQDGATDVEIDIERFDGRSERRWYPGPFAEGDIDLAGSHVATLELDGIYSAGFEAEGDFNGDGYADHAITWFGADRRDGELLLYFGPLRGVLDSNNPDVRIESTAGNSTYFLLQLVINVGDIDGDGTDDVAIRSGQTFNGIPEAGATFIFKGPLRRGHLLDTDADAIINWPAPLARTGHTVTALGDVDGDERADFGIGVWADRRFPPPSFPLDVVWPPPTASPADTAQREDSGDTATGPVIGLPFGNAEGAIMVFGDVGPGVLGPQDAKFTLMGTHPGDFIGWAGVVGPGDLDGDGLGDLAYSADAYGTGVRIRVVHPCTDFGQPAVVP
jgi:hypothetical protein